RPGLGWRVIQRIAAIDFAVAIIVVLTKDLGHIAAAVALADQHARQPRDLTRQAAIDTIVERTLEVLHRPVSRETVVPLNLGEDLECRLDFAQRPSNGDATCRSTVK